VGVIGASYLVELLIAPPDWSAAAFHAVVPRLGDGEAVLLAVGIVGATVMPHAIYLHSGLTQDRVLPRTNGERKRVLQFSNREVVLALVLSQVVLSLILPVPMTALLILTRRRDVMGSYANRRMITAAATAAAAIVLVLNLLLVLQIVSVPLPALA
jgi:manganese transport protein